MEIIKERIKVLKSELEEDKEMRENLINQIRELTDTLESLNLRITNSKAVLAELKSLKEKEGESS